MEVDGECFVAAAAGEHHTLVVNQYGDVCTFGRGKEGQLGHGEASRLDTVDAPRKVGGWVGGREGGREGGWVRVCVFRGCRSQDEDLFVPRSEQLYYLSKASLHVEFDGGVLSRLFSRPLLFACYVRGPFASSRRCIFNAHYIPLAYHSTA